MQLNKLSEPNSSQKESKMFDYMVKKSSRQDNKAEEVESINNQGYHTNMQDYIETVKVEKNKLDDYLKNISRSNSKTRLNRPSSKKSISNFYSHSNARNSTMKASRSTNCLSKSRRDTNCRNGSSFRDSRISKDFSSVERKIQCYEKAKDILEEGGLSANNIKKRYIESEKLNLPHRPSQKRSLQTSPPKFTAHSNQYNEMKRTDAIMETQMREKKILDECTFSPNISQPNFTVRDPDQFYRDQNLYEIRKIEKINQLEKEIHDKENAMHKPFLSKISEEIAQKRQKDAKPVHERLYSEH